MLNNNLVTILLITFCLVIFVIQHIKKINLEIKELKNNIKNKENFSMTEDQIKETVLNTVDQVYNMDTDAIRNLGAISKSILTGKNYHNLSGTATPGKLVIPADVEIQGNLTVDGNAEIKGNLTVDDDLAVDGNAEIGPAYIGSSPGYGSNYAQFSHKDCKNAGEYAVIQSISGSTLLNSKNGVLHFRKNNITAKFALELTTPAAGDWQNPIIIGNDGIGGGKYLSTHGNRTTGSWQWKLMPQ